MTDCSSIQGSTASSSSDVITTSSSWCAITPNSSRIRVIRLVRPHSRRVLVTPDNNASYGFAVRGGREFGTGFFISKVERNSEADLKGLRVGDQIIRVNGYRVDDAVHKEFTQFVTSQDRLTIKVRGVGMFPMKEKQNDPLTWHVLKMPQSSGCSENVYRSSSVEKKNRCSLKDIRIVLEVVPRTKLGLGICKGPEWKPGIFVQFTKEKSVARESGLRPGDQILSVNSIDFSDVLFSEAVAVMKSSSTLDMVIRTGSGLDLFPGESSGYNSSASSVTGDQSPCWADASAKRLTSVREEPTSASSKSSSYSDRVSLDRRKTPPLASIEMNRTIIKLSENGGASINNTIISSERHQMSNGQSSNFADQDRIQLSSVEVPPPPLLPSQITAGTATTATTTADNNNLKKINDRNNEIGGGGGGGTPGAKLADICFVSRQRETKTVIVEVHRSASDDSKNQQLLSTSSTPSPSSSTSLVPTAGGGRSGSGNFGTSSSNKYNEKIAYGSLKTIRGNDILSPPPAAINSGIYGKSIAPGIVGAVGGSGTSLTNAITEELRKRKEKRQSNNAINSNSNSNMCTMKQRDDPTIYSPTNVKQMSNSLSSQSPLFVSPPSSTATMKHQQQQHQQQHYKRSGTLSLLPTSSSSPLSSSSSIVPATDAIVNDDQHSALMNEFKRAHQRMFKNGYVESDTKQERKEALKNTTIMSDEVDHRSSNSNGIANRTNGTDRKKEDQIIISPPPPPPQFANNNNNNSSSSKQWHPPVNNNKTSEQWKPPISPTPDYDTINNIKHHRKHSHTGGNSGTKPSNCPNIPKPPPPMIMKTNDQEKLHQFMPTKRSSRPGSIVIGEYASSQINRKDPSKLDFIGTNQNKNESNQRSHLQQPSESLQSELQKTLSKSNLKKSNENENVDGQQQQQQQQQAISSNIHKLTKMLQNQQHQHQQKIASMAKGSSATLNNRSHRSNNTSISNGRNELRKTESMPIAPPPPEYASVGPGILKNGPNHHSAGHYVRNHSTTEKSISFGN